MGLPASLDLLLTADILICIHIIIIAADTEAEVSYPVTDSSTTSIINSTATPNGKLQINSLAATSPLLNPPYINIILTCTQMQYNPLSPLVSCLDLFSSLS